MGNERRGYIPPETVVSERMSDEYAGRLLAAIGNLESKALLMSYLASQPNAIFTENEMERGIARIQGITPHDDLAGWVPDSGVLGRYCSDSLSGVGLVASRISTDSGTIGYFATEKGREEGAALAGHMLDFSNRHDRALRTVLSVTSTQSKPEEGVEGEDDHKSRAPINRLKIFRGLFELDLPVRVKDLAEKTGLDEDMVGEHSNSLKWENLIVKKSANKEGPRTDYVFKQIPDNFDFNTRFKSLAMQVFEIFVSDPEATWTRNSILQALIERYPEKVGQTALDDSVRKVLSALKRMGALDTPNFFQGSGSSIELTGEQRALIGDFVGIMDRFQKRDSEFYRRGRMLASEFVTNPELARQVMRRSNEASPHAVVVPARDIKDAIKTALYDIPDGTAEQIRGYLNEHYDYNLAMKTIRRYLKNLRDDGVAISNGAVGSVMHWNINKAS